MSVEAEQKAILRAEVEVCLCCGYGVSADECDDGAIPAVCAPLINPVASAVDMKNIERWRIDMSVETEQRATLRVNADRSSCCGYGVCAEICPDVYKLDEAGLIIVDGDNIVPAGMEDLAREAAESCPQGCLHLEPIEE